MQSDIGTACWSLEKGQELEMRNEGLIRHPEESIRPINVLNQWHHTSGRHTSSPSSNGLGVGNTSPVPSSLG
jgi:hypothetical protein